MSAVRIFDNVLPDPDRYRECALKMEFRSYDFGHVVFHGIAAGITAPDLPAWIAKRYPRLTSVLTFFRKSPQGQIEPHFIHTDIDMGDWTCLLYLTKSPPGADGTRFWRHRQSGAIGSSVPHERSEEGKDLRNWELHQHVPAVFNRAVMFPSSYFHSRAIADNYGSGDGSRLVQVVFGTGDFGV